MSARILFTDRRQARRGVLHSLSAALVLGTAVALVAPSAAFAEGGNGGGTSPGGGGPDQLLTSGYVGDPGGPNSGAGGGGAGSTGGNGGVGGNGTGGTGGIGGASAGANGGNGGASSAGGGGGGGGAHGYVGDALPTGPTVGGNGGRGGSGGTGSGGGGGAAGYGAVLTSSSNVVGTISSNITGGDGGSGGSGGSGVAGSAGTAGVGLMLATGNYDITVSAEISGGAGGFSGVGGGGLPSNGGIGLVAADGSQITVASTGKIQGGVNYAGNRANAILFEGTNSTLTLHSEATINGLVTGETSSTHTLQLGGTTDGTFNASRLGPSGGLQAFSTFNKIDSATWTLTGTSSFVGVTNVQAGTMALNANMASSDFTVSSGATLKGVGQTGDLTLDTGATHAPGNSIGTQTVNGNYLLNSGAILEIEANAAGQSDKVVVVGGTVSLTGAILQVLAAPGTYSRRLPTRSSTTTALIRSPAPSVRSPATSRSSHRLSSTTAATATTWC